MENMETSTGEPAGTHDPGLESLLLRARDGDVAAYEAFYTATVRLVLPSVRRICGENYCEDALADAYFQAWKTLPSYDPARGSALAWLKTIARSRALDALRSDRRLHDGLVGAPDCDPDREPCPAAGPQEIVEGREQQARLHAALALLPSRQRQLLALAYDRGCTHDEISAMTGLSTGAVRHLLRQTHVRLHDTLRGGDDASVQP